MLKSRFLRPWQLLCGAFLLLALADAAIGAPKPTQKPAAVKPLAKPVAKPSATPKPQPRPAGPSPREVYVAQCSFCHAPKAAKVLPDAKAWVSLLYTSGCPEVTVKLAETQRRAIRAHIEAEFKAIK